MIHKFVIELIDTGNDYKNCVDYLERIYGAEEITDNEIYNQALEDFERKLNTMLAATDLRDNGYYIENLVSIAKNELKYRR